MHLLSFGLNLSSHLFLRKWYLWHGHHPQYASWGAEIGNKTGILDYSHTHHCYQRHTHTFRFFAKNNMLFSLWWIVVCHLTTLLSLLKHRTIPKLLLREGILFTWGRNTVDLYFHISGANVVNTAQIQEYPKLLYDFSYLSLIWFYHVLLHLYSVLPFLYPAPGLLLQPTGVNVAHMAAPMHMHTR